MEFGRQIEMRITRLIVTALTLFLVAGLLPALAQTDWEVAKTFQIGGQGGWDYLTVDPQTHWLYVPRTTHTMVIDAKSGKTIADIPGPEECSWRGARSRGGTWLYQRRGRRRRHRHL